MANPEISSIIIALTFTSFCSSGFNIISLSGYIGTDLFRNSNQQSLECMTLSSSKTFFILKTKSTFSWISDTKV